MAIGTRSYARPYAAGGGIPWGIKALLIANTAMFLLCFFLQGPLGGVLRYLELTPAAVVRSFQIWQLFTYQFLHFGVLQFVFNMLALWWFGPELEGIWGTARFLRFYLLCGCGAGLCAVAAGFLFGAENAAIVGASGPIYAILAASAAIWPERDILYFFFPMKMKYFVLLIAAVDFLLSYGHVSYMALLTGLLFGYFYVKYPFGKRSSFDPMASIQAAYKRWKLQRAKRKFQVYLRKNGSDRDRFIN
jgi:membrane associated rhomboid family serine protease